MLQIIFLLLGIVYAVRRTKLKRLRPEQFPSVPPDELQEWRSLELLDVGFFLCATWGLLILSIPARMVSGSAFSDGGFWFTAVFLALFSVLGSLAAFPGNRAKRLKEKYRIKWP